MLLYIFLVVALGGKGSNTGVLVGTFLVVFVLESTRFATEILPGISPVRIAAGRGMLIGICFLAVLQLRPWGMVRERCGVSAGWWTSPSPLSCVRTSTPDRAPCCGG
jgi:branched-chain amino acid transport system permease protein